MYKLLFRWAFNDFLLLRLLAYMIAASSKTKLGAVRGHPQSSLPRITYAKKVSFLLKPLLVLGFRPLF
jgi:hypothetical protein